MVDIAIIVTTMNRDELLDKAITSMLANLPEGAIILVGDQGNNQDIQKIAKYSEPPCFYFQLPQDCGLSRARNYLVQKAMEFGCHYCVIASDSMIFNKNTKNFDLLVQHMDGRLADYDCIGCHLNGGVPIYWVGWINLKPGIAFELEFIDRDKYDIDLFDCSIIHNFFIAKTSSLATVKWDDNLKLAEHEDFFYRYHKEGYKVAWTPRISCDYIRSRTGIADTRQRNWHDGLQKLYQKWGINHWIDYKNREFGFWGVQK